MEIKIASLEEDLLAANGEKEAAIARNEILVSELEATSCKLETTNSELKTLQEEVSSLVCFPVSAWTFFLLLEFSW